MANIKWSGIESWKYGLTARWYVDAYYGNDTDIDGVGYYNPTTNPYGHGGPTRPFCTLSKINQDSNVASGACVVVGSGYYGNVSISKAGIVFVGDGHVVLDKITIVRNGSYFFNIVLTQFYCGGTTVWSARDCAVIYATSIGHYGDSEFINVLFVECVIVSAAYWTKSFVKCVFISCSGSIFSASLGFQSSRELIFINCSSLTIYLIKPRPTGIYIDYSCIIGSVKTNVAIKGKTTGVTIEDFKADGNYFLRSYSEVDLFGNASGSGASVAQLQTIFNNYFSPIYLDTWMFADLSLKPTASDIVKFGGLNGTYIGALPVGYHFTSQYLWNNRNQTNTADLELDSIYNYLQIVSTAEYGTYESNEIDLGSPVIVDPVNFFANLVYNANGTVKQGVANQRIDTDPDAAPDNTLKQRVVYSYELSYSPNGVDALSGFKPFELNRKPTIDASGDTQLEDNFNVSEQTFITVQRFKIRFVLRKVVIS